MTAVRIRLELNGEDRAFAVEPRISLAEALRTVCGLTGTHIGCDEGVCGACTVLVDGEPVRACLYFAVQANGREVTTVEGLSDGINLTPVQAAFQAEHAVQCGFCTAGFLMLAEGALRRGVTGEEAVAEVASANLCRCTGYTAIIRALRKALGDAKASG